MSTIMQGLEIVWAGGSGGYILLKEASVANAVFVPEFDDLFGSLSA